MSMIRTHSLWCMLLNFGGLTHERDDFCQHPMILVSDQNSVSSISYGRVFLVQCDVLYGFRGFCLECVRLGVLAFVFCQSLTLVNVLGKRAWTGIPSMHSVNAVSSRKQSLVQNDLWFVSRGNRDEYMAFSIFMVKTRNNMIN